jgi:hypothetical protein
VQDPSPTLDDVTRLTRESDFTRFVAPGVDSAVRNAAMKKLFTDPHFNVMDGLDTYIDDYGKPDPIEPAFLRRMNQARDLGLFDSEQAGAQPSTGGPAALEPARADRHGSVAGGDAEQPPDTDPCDTAASGAQPAPPSAGPS